MNETEKNMNPTTEDVDKTVFPQYTQPYKGAVALSPPKKTNRSLTKGIERFAAFVYNKIAKHHQQESEDIVPRHCDFCAA